MKVDLSKYQSKDPRWIWNLYGPPGAGKTTTAMTLSKYWPKEPFKNKRPVILKDVFYWQWDPNGSDCLRPLKIKLVPQQVLNMPAIIAEMGFPKAMRQACRWAEQVIQANPEIAIEIHDTISSMDAYSLAHIKKTVESEEPWKTYGPHLDNHRHYAAETTIRPARISSVYLFHEKVIDETAVAKTANKATKDKDKSKRMHDANVNIVPDVTGGGEKLYLNAVSQEFSISMTALPGKPGCFKREMHPLNTKGRRAKSRFTSVFSGSGNNTLPLDLNIPLEMIQKACK